MVSMTKDSYCIEIAVIIVFNFGEGGGYALPYTFFSKLVTS